MHARLYHNNTTRARLGLNLFDVHAVSTLCAPRTHATVGLCLVFAPVCWWHLLCRPLLALRVFRRTSSITTSSPLIASSAQEPDLHLSIREETTPPAPRGSVRRTHPRMMTEYCSGEWGHVGPCGAMFELFWGSE